jgi:hypothetical protein
VSRARRGFEAHKTWLRAAGPVALALLALAQANQVYGLSRRPDNRLEIYRAAGNWLRSNTPADATVGTLEVGIIGYYAERTMIDYAGLLQPAVAQQLTPTATYDDSVRWATRAYQPDYVVINRAHLPALAENEVRQNCRLVQAFEGPGYGFPGTLEVFACAW